MTFIEKSFPASQKQNLLVIHIFEIDSLIRCLKKCTVECCAIQYNTKLRTTKEG